MIERITFAAEDGRTASGVLGAPGGDQPAGAVVLLQEWWGVNAHIASLVERLAAAGFLVLAPDLYEGRIATDAATASAYMTELKWPRAFEIVKGAAATLRAHPRCNGKLGVTGFCMGGAGALLAAATLAGFDAAVAFYGVPPAELTDWSTAETPPLQAHFSASDPWARVSRAEEIGAALKARGRGFELFVYEAEHAFVNDTRPEVYSPADAMLAWSRMVGFFHQHLR